MQGGTGGGAPLTEWRSGWPTAAIGALGVAVSQLHVVSLGFLIGPLEAEFGWSRSQITASTLIFSVLTALIAPFAGRVIDKLSERRIGIPTIAGYCAFLALLSQTGPSIYSWWAVWVGLGLISPFSGLLLWTTVVARRFDKQRGLALALTLCGSSVATASMPFLTFWLITNHGWRGAYLALGGASALALLPLALLVLRSTPPIGAQTPSRERISLAAAFRSPLFVRIAIAGSIMSMAATTMSIHFVPMLLQRGAVPQTAAAAAGLVGIGAIVGRIVTGALLDRTRGPIIGVIAYAIPLIPALMLYTLHPAFAVATVIGFLWGLSSGAETDVIAYFTARYFGVAQYGVFFGALSSAMVLFSGLGPWLASLAYDATGSYTPVILSIVPLAAIAAYAVGSLGPYPVLDSGDKES